MEKVLLIGQILPPIVDQEICIGPILGANYKKLQIVYVPMGFSKEMKESVNLG